MNEKYHISSRLFHWVMSILIIGMLVIGMYMVDFISDENQNKFMIYDLHKSFGLLILLLVILRIINRIFHKPPKQLEGISRIEVAISKSLHHSFYVLMILLPVSGYLMSNFYGFKVNFFSYELPSLVSYNPDMGRLFSETHEFLAYLLIFLLILHIAGVIKHRFFDKPENDVLKRML